MDRVNLHQTGLEVSRVVLGTMTFGGQADESTSGRIIDLAIERGIDFFDTANVYNKGVTEEILGRLLGARRQRIVLASKVFNKMGDAPDEKGLSRAAIFKGIEDSLRRLKTDYLDLYYLHAPDWTVPLEESLEAVQRLVEQGKVRYPALSNYAAWQVVQAIECARRNQWQPAVITQPMYNLLARGLEQEYFAMCRQYQVSTVVYNPIAGGLLTGKHKREGFTAGTRFDNNKMYQDRYWHPEMFDAVDTLQQVAGRENRSLISLALNWVMRHTPVDCMILGATSPEQLAQNLDALNDGPLSAESLQACEEVWIRLRGCTPKYNR